MSHLSIVDDQLQTHTCEFTDGNDIARELNAIDVLFERWEAETPVADDTSQEEVIEAYRGSVDRLMEKFGFQSVDVVSLTPDHPDKEAFRKKFLDEHTHSEFEVRFFIDGKGLFYLHADDKVYTVLCEKGDLISVPSGVKHWFDMGSQPHFKCIRFFTSPDGWTANFTGDDIASRFSENGLSMVKAILTDIEGTTSSISFVKDVLFPYAREKLADYVAAHGNEAKVRKLLEEANDIAGGSLDDEAIVEQMQRWIDEDRKVTPLKSLQGLIWEAGYRNVDFTGQMYADATEYLKKWHAEGLKLYVYSSGSVYAQKLLYGHSDHGDLTPLFSEYFDTTIGGKKEVASYQKIAEEIGLPAIEILFLSDIAEELDAAKQAGMQTYQLVRDENVVVSTVHPMAGNFSAIKVS